MGVVNFTADDYWPLNTVLFVTDFHGNDPRFAYYLLRALDFSRFNSGSAQASLNRNFLAGIEIHLPDVDEQRRISSVLGALDDKIDSNRRLATALEAMVAATFRGRFLDQVGRGADQTPSGEPRLGTLNDLAETSKESVQPNQTPEAIFEHFSIPAFDAGGYPEEVGGATILSGKTRIPSRDVVLLSKLNPRTKRVWWPRPSGSGTPVCSSEFLVLVPRAGIPASYLYAVVGFDERFYGELLSHVTGTTGSRQRVKPQDALGCAAVIPSAEELRAWDAFARPLLDLAHETRTENNALASIRDALLPRLVSAAIRVPDSSDVEDAMGVAAEQVVA